VIVDGRLDDVFQPRVTQQVLRGVERAVDLPLSDDLWFRKMTLAHQVGDTVGHPLDVFFSPFAKGQLSGALLVQHSMAFLGKGGAVITHLD